MKKILLLISLFVSATAFANEVFYFEQPAQLTGKLSSILSRHPNPEFGGKPQPTIFLNQPIDVVPNQNDNYNGEERNVTKIQLSYGAELATTMKKLKNKSVRISCKDLFAAHTAHHSTGVLCSVEAIKLIKRNEN